MKQRRTTKQHIALLILLIIHCLYCPYVLCYLDVKQLGRRQRIVDERSLQWYSLQSYHRIAPNQAIFTTTTTNFDQTVFFNHTLSEYDSWNMIKQYSFLPSPLSSSSSSSSSSSLQLIPHANPSSTSSHPSDHHHHHHNPLSNLFYKCFLPSGELSSDYYRYTSWRAIQRLIAATNSVFCTQALFLALGFKKSSTIGIAAAATTWVLKDGLGKCSRIFWATFYGKKFDMDAKKWRFRSALFFAIGNLLEIITFFQPNYFLLSAAIANALKQSAMLTYSATRNTIYKSFATNLDNIGDITAKGEAQVAVIDILGMISGIAISKAFHTSKLSVVVTFITLTLLDLISGYFEIRSVVFYSLNFERTRLVLPILYQFFENIQPSTTTPPDEQQEPNQQEQQSSQKPQDGLIQSLSPARIATQESMLFSALPTDCCFSSWSKLRLPNIPNSSTSRSSSIPQILSHAIEQSNQWNDGKFLLFFDISSNPWQILWERSKRFLRITSSYELITWKTKNQKKDEGEEEEEEDGGSKKKKKKSEKRFYLIRPQILLRKQANNEDIFQAIVILHRFLYELKQIGDSSAATAVPENKEELTNEVIQSILTKAQGFTKQYYLSMKEILMKNGWDMKRLMFGSSIPCRVDW